MMPLPLRDPTSSLSARAITLTDRAITPLITFEHKNDSSNVKPYVPRSAPKRWGMARLGHTHLWMVSLYVITRALFSRRLENEGGWLGEARQRWRRGIKDEPAARFNAR